MSIEKNCQDGKTNEFSDKRLNVGLIGVGRIVEIVHLPLLAKKSDIKIIALYDKELSRCADIASKYNIPNACNKLNDLLALDIDLVIISTPNYLHAEQSIMALEAGKHVLCEKPMALNVKEAEYMIRVSEATGNKLLIGYNNRFRIEVLNLHKIIHSGQIGKIREIRCGWLRKNGIPGVGSWFTKKSFSGGGALIDIGSHIIDLALWLSGYPRLKKLTSKIENYKIHENKDAWYKPKENNISSENDIDVETGVTIKAIFSDSIEMSMEFSWNCDIQYDRTYITVIGDEGKAEIDTLFGLSPFGNRPEKPLRIWSKNSSEFAELDGCVNPISPYIDQFDFFVDSIRKCRNISTLLNGSLATLKFVEDVYYSSFNNQAIVYE